MRALLQRVSSASVSVDGREISRIGPGLLILLGIRKGDDPASGSRLAGRTAQLRIFPDAAGKMGTSLVDAGGAALVVSQMTLYGDVTRGRRPSFETVAPGPESRPLYESYVAALRGLGITVETGEFGATMAVSLVNDGPVTFLLEEPAPAP